MDVGAARSYASQHLQHALPQRWTHTQAVAATATRLCEALVLDPDVLVSAAWLHDVGHAPDLVVTGVHALDGARALAALGWPARVVDLVARHSGAADEARERGLAEQVCAHRDERGPTRDALWSADATTGPTGRRTSVEARLAEALARHGRESPLGRALVALGPQWHEATARTSARLAVRAHLATRPPRERVVQPRAWPALV